MVEHRFAKNMTLRMRENLQKAFKSLEPVSKMKPHRYELPITSIRRVLGDDFYKMESKDDLLNLVIFDTGSFNIEEFKINVDKSSELVSYISTWFQGFVEANNFSTKFTPEFMSNKVGKVCITSPNGMKSIDICLDDIKSLSLYGDDGTIVGMKNVKEISSISAELQKNDAAYRQMQQTGNQEAIKTLDSQRNEYLSKLSQYQVEIIEEFFKLIKNWSGVEDVKEIFDVLIFGISVADEKGETKINQTTVYDYHDGSAKVVQHLQKKFGLDFPEFEKEMSK